MVFAKPQKNIVQEKTHFGQPNNRYEQESDAVANQLMKIPASQIPPIQRKCEACEVEDKLRRKPITSFIQKKGSNSGMLASDSVSNQINSSSGKGSSLPISTKNFMESRFGTEFSNVNIHTGGEAARLSRNLGAKAFTVGNDIFFNQGQYNPNSRSGQYLLAHELTHTIQQSGSGFVTNVQRLEITDCNTSEQEILREGTMAAHTRLNQVLSRMNVEENAIPPNISDSLWLAFRTDTINSFRRVKENLTWIRDNLFTSSFFCGDDRGHCEESGALGFLRPSTGNIHFCVNPPETEGTNSLNPLLWDTNELADLIIHETAHRFLGVDDTGYYANHTCLEMPREFPNAVNRKKMEPGSEGRTPDERFFNADSFSCFVNFLLTMPSGTRARRASSLRGENLNISQEPGGNIYLGSLSNSYPLFRIRTGLPSRQITGFRYRWTLEPSNGIAYSLSSHGSLTNTFDFSYDSAYFSTNLISLIRSNRIRSGKIVCHVLIPGMEGEILSIESQLNLVLGNDSLLFHPDDII